MRGRRRENFQKTSWETKKISPRLRPPSLLFFKLVSSTLWPFCCFYLTYASFRSVTAKKDKTPPPGRKDFCRSQWTGNSTRWTFKQQFIWFGIDPLSSAEASFYHREGWRKGKRKRAGDDGKRKQKKRGCVETKQLVAWEAKKKKNTKETKKRKSIINPSTKFAGSCFRRLV